MNISKTYSTFHIEDFYFGILTTDVTELTKENEVTTVPLAPASVHGLINLRGRIVTAINMRQRLGMTQSQYSDKNITIFLSHKGDLFGLLVDGVSDILELDAESFEPPPSNMAHSSQDMILGVHKLADKLLFILDPAKIIDGIELTHD